MHCPLCKARRTRVLRTKCDREFPAADVLRQCRNPECLAVFRTAEQLVEIIENPSDALRMRAIEAQLELLSPAGRKAVRSVIERMSLAAIPQSLPPAQHPARRSA